MPSLFHILKGPTAFPYKFFICLTFPPFLIILYFYAGSEGLWSFDKGTKCFFLDKIALESPTLAQYIFYLSIFTRIAVEPDKSTSNSYSSNY